MTLTMTGGGNGDGPGGTPLVLTLDVRPGKDRLRPCPPRYRRCRRCARLTVSAAAAGGGAVADPAVAAWARTLVASAVGGVERVHPPAGCGRSPFRSLSGVCNSREAPAAGAAGAPFRRLPGAPAAYGDGVASPAGAWAPSARAISNALGSSTAEAASAAATGPTLSALVWVWGQSLAHDLSLTSVAERGPQAESFDIPVPAGDPVFSASTSLSMHRTAPARVGTPCCGGGMTDAVPRAVGNAVTPWMDASQVYGVDAMRGAALRSGVGGTLRTSAGGLLPFNGAGVGGVGAVLPNEPSADPRFHAAGDVRANENPLLLALHCVWVREHNRWAGLFAAAFPLWGDQDLYDHARQAVVAAQQKITYEEWLPALLGNASGSGLAAGPYNPRGDPALSHLFSTAGLRIGHTMVGAELAVVGPSSPGEAPPSPTSVRLADVFFAPEALAASGIDSLLRGAAATPAEPIDGAVIEDLRNLLFTRTPGRGTDLLALNIQRGRDHGLPRYNAARAAVGLPRVTSWAAVAADTATAGRLADVYGGDLEALDAVVGGLAEPAAPGAAVGPFFAALLGEQFRALAAADRHAYTRRGGRFSTRVTQSVAGLGELRPGGRYTLATLLTASTGVVAGELPASPFWAPPPQG